MGLIERIKSALGLGTSASTSQPAPSSTDGPSRDDGGPAAADGDDGVGVTVEHEPATASEDAVKGTDTAGDGASASVDSPEGADTGEPDAESETADDETATDAPTEPAPDAQLEEIKGIGPTYGERLREAGIAGVSDLAEADPEALAEETDIAASRVENWVEQAKFY